MGKPDPDVVANGRMSFGSTALNQVTYAPNYDGSLASDLWAGTSLSAPTASGILALVYEAYRKSDHRVDNETIPDFTPVGSKNRAIMDHRPVTPGTFNLYLNGTLVPQANYVMFPGNGTLFLDLAVSSADVYTASYVFYDDYPDALTAKSLIMSSADDLNFDILSQGAGFVNAERATNLANSIDGIMVSPNTWSPGEFRGKKYPASVNLMTPGSYENKTFSIHNANSTSGTTVNITDAVFERMEEINYTVKTKSTVAHWSIVYMANYMKHNLSAPGIVNMTDNEEYWLADIDETVWLNTELLKISADSKQYLLDPNLDGTLDSQYWMDVYDWTCRRPCDSSGDYNPVTPGPAADFTGAELNRINVDHPDGNAMEVRIHNPAQRIHDGLWISLRPVLGDVEGIEFTITLEFYRKADWNWLETDKQVVLGPGDSVDGTKTFNANLSVPSGTSIGSYEGAMYLYENKGQSNETFWGLDFYPVEHIKLAHDNVASANVYENGTLMTEGINYTLYPKVGVIDLAQNITSATNITVEYWYYHVTTIPILVNVPAESVDFSFGDNAPGQDELFMNNVIGGFGNGGRSGDWRFYFLDLPDQGTFSGDNIKFYLNVSWENNLTDIDVFSFGEGGSNPAGVQYAEERFGPVLFMENKGGSEETGAFYTTTNNFREVVLPPLTGGLNIIAIHNVKMNGTVNKEAVRGEVGMMQVTPSELKIVTNKLTGNRSVSLYATKWLHGLGGVAAGPSAPERIVNISIKQDDVSGISTNDDFLRALADGGYTKFVTVKKSALIFGANITSLSDYVDKPCKDLDLGVFMDGLGADNVPDDIATMDELVTYDADQDAEERIKIIKPKVEDDPDTPNINEAVEGAPYIIKVLGYDTSGECLFNMDVTLVQGLGFTVEGETTQPIPPFTVSSLGVSWSLPGDIEDGTLLGAFYVGPHDAPMALLVPIELILERDDPDHTGLMARPQLTNFEILTDKGVNFLDNTTTNDNRPTVVVSVSDNRGELDWQSVKVYLDEMDITSMADITINFEDPDGRDGPKEFGYWSGLISYTPPAPLLDKPLYIMRYVVKDLAGNTANEEFLFSVDTVPPALPDDELTPTGDYSTSQSTVVVSGETDPGATVIVRTVNITATSNGSFSTNIALEPGINDISVTAIDWFDLDVTGNILHGNSVTKTIRIIYDEIPPTISSVTNSTGSPTSKEFTTVKGFVADKIGNSVTEYPWDPTMVDLKINGIATPINAEGFFSAHIPLEDGLNMIHLEAVDDAGNSNDAYQNIIRDVTPPTLSIEDVPSEVDADKITIEGNAEPGSAIFINGQYVTGAGGDFSFEVSLNEGLNLITVEAVDEAGNKGEPRVYSVTYTPPSQLDVSIPLFVIVLIIVFLIGLQLGKSKGTGREEEFHYPDEAQDSESQNGSGDHASDDGDESSSKEEIEETEDLRPE
jgi:hypothetical protein